MEDLYPDANNVDASSTSYGDILAKMEKLDTELHKVHKKKKKSKKDGKKKVKKRLKELKMQHKQLKRALKEFALQQNMVRQNPAWWQEALTTSLPKALELASVVLRNRSQQIPLSLPDSRDRK